MRNFTNKPIKAHISTLEKSVSSDILKEIFKKQSLEKHPYEK